MRWMLRMRKFLIFGGNFFPVLLFFPSYFTKQFSCNLFIIFFIFFLLCVEFKLKLKKLDAGWRLASANNKNFCSGSFRRETWKRERKNSFFWVCGKMLFPFFLKCISKKRVDGKNIKYLYGSFFTRKFRYEQRR